MAARSARAGVRQLAVRPRIGGLLPRLRPAAGLAERQLVEGAGGPRDVPGGRAQIFAVVLAASSSGSAIL